MAKLKEYLNNREDIYLHIQRDILHEFTSRLDFLINNCDYNKVSQETKKYVNCIDYFQFHYVRYLCGYESTRRRTFEELKNITECKQFSGEDFSNFLGEIERFLLKRELYEALAKFSKTNRLLEERIAKLTPKLPQ